MVEAIRFYYPATINDIEKNKRYNYISLFGIRVDTCDTGKADDVIGCVWMNALGVWCSLICAASTDPSPYYIDNPKTDAAKAGGTAWVKEGQYAYCLVNNWKGFSAFRPLQPIPVYRMPSGQGLDITKAVLSTSNDTLIHRSWGSVVFKKDSAGCNILKNNQELEKIATMAREHIKKYKLNVFTYTLLTKQQVEIITNKDVVLFQSEFFNDLFNTVKMGIR